MDMLVFIPFFISCQEGLIFLFIFLCHPMAKSYQCFLWQKLFLREPAFADRQSQLLIDKTIIKANCCSIRLGISVIKVCWPGPVNSPQAHGAGFATAVNGTAMQLEIIQDFAGIANGCNFGMGSRVIAVGNYICTSGYDLSIFYHKCCKRPALTCLYIFNGKTDGFPHKIFFLHSSKIKKASRRRL